jgi:hypothetical protein
MTTPDPLTQLTQDAAENEVIKKLETRGLQGLDTLSLEELQLLTERKRKQLHKEAVEKKASLESEISSIETQIQELGAKKIALAAELDAVLKSLGLPTAGGDRPARRTSRKPPKVAEAEEAPSSES